MVRLHVNSHIIRANQRTGARDPALTIRRGRKIERASAIDILDTNGAVVARVIYSPDKPLSCGARVWIEAHDARSV